MQSEPQKQGKRKALYSVNAFAEEIDASRSLVYSLMKQGKLRYVTVGADRKIPGSELDRLEQDGA